MPDVEVFNNEPKTAPVWVLAAIVSGGADRQAGLIGTKPPVLRHRDRSGANSLGVNVAERFMVSIRCLRLSAIKTVCW